MTKEIDDIAKAAKKFVQSEFPFYATDAQAHIVAAYIHATAISKLAEKIAEGKITVNVAREVLGLTPFLNHA